MSPAFSLIQRFLREAAGLSFDEDKRYLVEDRLRPIMREAGLASLEELAARLHLARHAELARAVVETLTINETSFFRDRGLFKDFAERVLPALIAARTEQRRLRIWCAGCSSGQEPYSLAMVLDEQARRLAGWRVEILATDISQAMIEAAQRGLYSQFEVQRGIPVALLLRYFRREGESWRINDHLRAKVTFRAQNLVKGYRHPEPFDVIFCRNVLIYFDVDMKRRVLAALGEALAPDGWLALGSAETVAGLYAGIEPQLGQRFLFRRGVRATQPRMVAVGA